MNENSFMIKIKGTDKEFLIDNFSIENNGKIVYDLYSKDEIEENDKKDIENCIRKMIFGEV